jgi:hypothetical protein
MNLQCDDVAVFVVIRPVFDLARKERPEVFSDGLLSDVFARLRSAIIEFRDNIDAGSAYYPPTISDRMAKHRRTFKAHFVVEIYFHCETSDVSSVLRSKQAFRLQRPQKLFMGCVD